jgi:hypothetical protein
MCNFLLSFFILSLLSSQAHAWGLKELGDEAASPYTTDAKYTLFAGALLTLFFVDSEDKVGDPFQSNTVREKPLGES